MRFLCVALLVAAVTAKPASNVVPGEYSLFLQRGVTSASLSHLFSGKIATEMMSVATGKTYIILNDVSDELAARIKDSPLVTAFSQSEWVHLDEYDNNVEAVVTYDPTEVTVKKVDNCMVQSPPSVGNIWHLARVSSQSRDPIDTSYEYEFNDDGFNADVAVFDTGIDLRHPEFSGRAEHTFLASGLTSHTYEDINGHGTHVAGLVGGDVFGIAKGAQLLNYKVLGNTGSGSQAGITEGIIHMHNRMTGRGDSRRHVINMSLSGTSPNAARIIAIGDFVHDGGFVICSAGNNGAQTSTRFPAAYDDTIAVGATDINNNWASFSNFGSTTDVAGPGVSTFAAGSVHSNRCGPGNENCIVALSGTSMSAPVTAGSAARGNAPNQEALRAHFRLNGSKHGIINIAANQDPSNTPNVLVNKNDC